MNDTREPGEAPPPRITGRHIYANPWWWLPVFGPNRVKRLPDLTEGQYARIRPWMLGGGFLLGWLLAMKYGAQLVQLFAR